MEDLAIMTVPFLWTGTSNEVCTLSNANMPTFKKFCLKIKRPKYFLCMCLSASAFLSGVSSCITPEMSVYLMLCWLICFRFPTDMLMHPSEITSHMFVSCVSV